MKLVCGIAAVLLVTAPLPAHPAWGIVVDNSGRVYFNDLETVWRIDHGRLEHVKLGTSGVHIHELSIDADGNVYGPSHGQQVEGIWKLDRTGSTSLLFGFAPHLPRGASIWRDGDGNMYAVEEDNNRREQTLIVKRTPNGDVSVLAGGACGYADGTGTNARFSNIVAMIMAPDGCLYVTDGPAVRKVTLAGVVTTIAKGLDAPDPDARDPLDFGGLFGVAVSRDGTVYAADLRQRRVLKIDPSGNSSVALRAEAPWTPTGVAIGPAGELYILEVGFHPPGTWIKPRVRKVSSDGKVETLATVPQ
jgi:DNA-binding beta-propeller fold protein YncE